MMTPALACLPQSKNSNEEESDFAHTPPARTDWTQRAARLLAHEIAFVMHESFRSCTDEKAAVDAQQCAAAMKAAQQSDSGFKKTSGINVHYLRMCQTPLLSPDLELLCFRHYNWLKFKANIHRAKLNVNQAGRAQVVVIEQILQQAAEIRNYIIQANCRLAMSIVKKYSDSAITFEELLSEATATLMGAVEKFDFGRGFRFSTYATQSIHRRLFRILAQRQKQCHRYLNNSDDVLTKTLGAVELTPARHADERAAHLQQLLSQLDLRERLILEARFGLHTSGQKQTFLEISKKLRISKERVRQLAERALLKLRSLAEDLNVELA